MAKRSFFVFKPPIPVQLDPPSTMVRPLLSSPYFRLTAALFLVLLTTLLLVDRPVKMEKRITERRQLQGKDAPTHWLIPVWLWRGLAMNTGLAALLVALTPLAARANSPAPGTRPLATPFTGREKMLLTASLILLAASTTPRLGQSLWGDEEYCMKAYIAPKPVLMDDAHWRLEPRPWSTTLWDYQRPTNHIGFTVVARLVHDSLFTPGPGARSPWFSEMLMRLPSFLAGLAAILTLVWCCRVWGLRHGLGWIALGYAGHAWLVRFGCDARGYGFIVMLVPVLLGTLGRASQTGLWRWWLAFALTQFYMLWTYPGVIHVPVAANALALGMLARQSRATRLPQASRWFAASLVSAMLVIGLMAPCLPPFLDFLKENRLQGHLDLPWLRDSAAALFCGALWHPFDPQNPLSASLSRGELPSWIAAAWLALGGLAAVLGVWRLWLKPDQRLILIFLLGGPALLLAHLVVGHTRPYQWYLIPFLPNLFILWAAAWDTLKLPSHRLPFGAILVFITLTGVHLLALPTARLLTRFPIEACRESAALTRNVTNPYHADFGKLTLTASPGMATEAYDPAVIQFDSPEALLALIDRARRDKRPLFLNFGYRALLQNVHPAIFALIDDPTLFEPVQTFPGQFISTTREVHRLRPAQD
jgi:hypothetical protein